MPSKILYKLRTESLTYLLLIIELESKTQVEEIILFAI